MSGNPCDTCAFGKSGGAADEANNRLMGIICALSGRPFWCHHARDGAEYDRANPLGPMVLPPNQRRLCAGWRATVAKLAKRGHFRFTKIAADQILLRRYQQSLGRDACMALDAFLATQEPVAKEKAHRDLGMCLVALQSEDGLP